MDEKTEWAEDRTVLAMERTFAAWARTGGAALSVAIGMRVIFNEADPVWLPKVVATVFVVAALIVFYVAWRQVAKSQDRLSGHSVGTSKRSRYDISTGGLSLGAVIAGGVVWMY
ncbi:MAG: DUF202 domain-containing protein [Pseudomonadota bacterium]